MQQVTSDFRYDPAPSRAAYRMHRIWLTPSVRFLVKAVLPAAAVVGLANWLIDGTVGQRTLLDRIEEIRRFVAERPEFMVRYVKIEGASDELVDRIREILPIEFPASTFDLKLDRLQSAIESLDAVGSAELGIRTGAILHIAVDERIPVAVWREGGKLTLVDSEGVRVAPISGRAQRPDLPLFVGAGVDSAIPEGLAIISAAEPLEVRLRGLLRVGQRRWDAVLDRNQKIMLPETGAVAALEYIVALDHAYGLLARNVSVVDMRNPRRPTVRLGGEAVDELRRIKELETVGANR